MAVFWVNTTIAAGASSTLQFPLDCEHEDLDGLHRELQTTGMLTGDKLALAPPRDGARVVIRRERVVLFPAGLRLLQPYSASPIVEYEDG